MHKQWRDCQEWAKLGLPMSTTNNEAAKMFDASLSQFMGWYDDPSVGGLKGSVVKSLEADPDFALGHVMMNGLELAFGATHPEKDEPFRNRLAHMETLLGSTKINKRERMHIEALTLFGKGILKEACLKWEELLAEYPLDLLALRLAHGCHLFMGDVTQERDLVIRVMPHWNPRMPHYGYLLGLLSFGYCETNMFAEAEKFGRKGLEINPQDAWSTHSIGHVMEMEGRANEGIELMSSTVNDWSTCSHLAGHNYWHWAVYHIEKGEAASAVDLYDAKLAPRIRKDPSMLDIADTSSMLYRLKLEGVDVGERWTELAEACRPYTSNHLMMFYDTHVFMGLLGSGQLDMANQMIESLRKFVKTNRGTNCERTKKVGITLCEAIVAYEEGNYARVVDLLLPIRYDIVTIGGSNAQRDVFNLFLIHAAMKSTRCEDKNMARQLLFERKALKENSPLTDRLMTKATLDPNSWVFA